jgi:prefoldin subunit 5
MDIESFTKETRGEIKDLHLQIETLRAKIAALEAETRELRERPTRFN